MTYYQSFKKKYLGKSVITNAAIGAQCLSLIKRYLYDNGGKEFSTGNRGAWSLALGDIPQVLELCTLYMNLHQSNGILEGDILVFGRTASNKYGHTAIADESMIGMMGKSIAVFQQDGFIDNSKNGIADGVAFESHFPLHNLTAILRPHWVVEENEKQETTGTINLDDINIKTGQYNIPTGGNGNVDWNITTRKSEPPKEPIIATPFPVPNGDKVEAKEQNWTLVEDNDNKPMLYVSDIKKEITHALLGLSGGSGILSILNETDGLGEHINIVDYFIFGIVLLAVLSIRLGVDDWLAAKFGKK